MADFEYPFYIVYDDVLYDIGCTKEDLDYIKDSMSFHEKDIVVATYPKAGTTWMQEIVFMMRHGVDEAKTRTQSWDEVFPFLECRYPDVKCGIEATESTSPPRTIKSHLRANFFQRQLYGESPCPKFIVVLRDPKDCMISYYKFHTLFSGIFKYPGSWDDFYKMYRDNRVTFGQYYPHVVGWSKYKSHPNVFFTTFEEMLKDIKPILRDLAVFLEIALNDDQIDGIAEGCSFKQMKERGVKHIYKMFTNDLDKPDEFFRKGKSGGWKEMMSEEQIKYFDEQTEIHLKTIT